MLKTNGGFESGLPYFFTISKHSIAGIEAKWNAIMRSEILHFGNQGVVDEWNKFSIPCQAFLNKKDDVAMNAELKIDVYQYNKAGNHTNLGSHVCTVLQLIESKDVKIDIESDN